MIATRGAYYQLEIVVARLKRSFPLFFDVNVSLSRALIQFFSSNLLSYGTPLLYGAATVGVHHVYFNVSSRTKDPNGVC